MKIYTYEFKAHNAPISSDPVSSDGQGVIEGRLANFSN